MRLFGVAAGPCDLRMNMLRLINRLTYASCGFFLTSNLTVMKPINHLKPIMWFDRKMCSCRIYLKEESLFEMRVAGFLLYLCFLLVRPEEMHYRNADTCILKTSPIDHQQNYYYPDCLWSSSL